MKKLLLLALGALFTWNASLAQTPTWCEDVAPIVYKKCTSCHNPTGIGPMSFMSYSAAFPYASWMSAEVAARRMPPWPPDTSYRRYVHDYKRILTQAELNTIVNWANNGAPEGDTTKAPTPPVYTSKLTLGTPDLKLQIPTYKSKAVADDDYVCFSIPSGLLNRRTVKAVEILPGNPAIVHHCLIFIDTMGTYATDTSGKCGGPTTNAVLLGSYEPGGSPTIFPDDGNTNRFGVNVPPGSNIVLAMHYPHGSAGQYDSTTVNLHFYPQSATGIRQVLAGPIIQNWSFCIDADSVQTITAKYPSGTAKIPVDISALAVFPHMHLLGKYIDCYTVDQNSDTVPLIRINNWNFDWQDSYFFQKIVKIPFNSKVYSSATYDNTSANPFNPNSPPQKVCAGLNTTDEMFLVFIHYTLYKKGDEYINQDSLRSLGLQELKQKEAIDLKVYPNPFSTDLAIQLTLADAEDVNFSLHDMNGRVLYSVKSHVERGEQVVDLTQLYGGMRKLPPGTYFQKVKYGGVSKIVKLIKL